MKKIANYDTVNYDYSRYWEKREYEHNSEVSVLKTLLKNVSGDWFLDIGGSYGRLLPTYYKKYNHCVIADYSLKTLQRNYESIKKEFPNTYLIAANAYNLPFKDNSFNASLMVRVLHHIVKPKEYFKEVYRVLSPHGIYIQEYANKLHIKAVLRAILVLDFSLFKKGPYQQPDKDHHEGARKHVKVPFFNYNSSWIRMKLKETGFKIEKQMGCSYLRLEILKKHFQTNFLLFWEKLFQKLLSFTNISPSIFVIASTTKMGESNKYKTLEELLVCPKCKNRLEIENEKAFCKQCNNEYLKKSNIWDFRI